MKTLKATICLVLALASSLCLFACGEKGGGTGGDDMNKIKLDAGVSEISVEHHGRTVYGDAYIPDFDSFPIVIMSHGYNGYKDDFKAEAQLLMKENIGAITLTFCGSGARDKSGFPTTSMTLLTEKEDLIAVIDYAKSIKGFNGKLCLLGGSQGGMVSALAAEDRGGDLAGMLLLYPGLSIPDDWNNHNYPVSQYPTYESIPAKIDWWGVQLGRDFVWVLRGMDAFKKMPDFKKPVLLMHDTNDSLVPYSYSERAAETYPDAELVSYPGGHGFTPTFRNDSKTKMMDFLFGIL